MTVLKECYDMVKRATIDEMCTQIYELFTYDPQKTLSSKEEERLLDISHAYGLLLYHYRKQYPNFEHIKRKCKQLQVSNDESAIISIYIVVCV